MTVCELHLSILQFCVIVVGEETLELI